MDTNEQQQMYEDWYKAELEFKEKWNITKQELHELIHPKYFDFAESNSHFYNEGIVEIYETDERTSGYSTYRHCRVKGASDIYLYVHCTGDIESAHDKESPYEGEEVEYWVWQTVGYAGDDYSGFLLLPMLDGRCWKIGFAC